MSAFEGVDPALYEDPATAAIFEADVNQGLQPCEAAALERFDSEIRGRAILDIGIGGGRTVQPLRAISGNYIGLDYSQAMVDIARKHHPEVDIRLGDVRDLSAFESDSFGLVMFSFNGIDSISHPDRLVALGEIRRVLVPGGLFVFSSHNEDYRPSFKKLWLDGLGIGRDPLRSPLRLVRSVGTVAKRARNHRKHRSQLMRGDDYSIICDGGFDHTELCYSVSRDGETRELAGVGFSTEAVFGLAGQEAPPGCRDQWLIFVARKPSDKT